MSCSYTVAGLHSHTGGRCPMLISMALLIDRSQTLLKAKGNQFKRSGFVALFWKLQLHENPRQQALEH